MLFSVCSLDAWVKRLLTISRSGVSVQSMHRLATFNMLDKCHIETGNIKVTRNMSDRNTDKCMHGACAICRTARMVAFRYCARQNIILNASGPTVGWFIKMNFWFVRVIYRTIYCRWSDESKHAIFLLYFWTCPSCSMHSPSHIGGARMVNQNVCAFLL